MGTTGAACWPLPVAGTVTVLGGIYSGARLPPLLVAGATYGVLLAGDTAAGVSVVAVPDRPSGLADVLAVISKGEIDVEYMYSLFTHGDEKAYMVFRVDDGPKLVDTLKSNNIELVSKEERGLK